MELQVANRVRPSSCKQDGRYIDKYKVKKIRRVRATGKQASTRSNPGVVIVELVSIEDQALALSNTNNLKRISTRY